MIFLVASIGLAANINEGSSTAPSASSKVIAVEQLKAVEMETRICSLCKVEKSIKMFSSRTGGIRYQCKECESESGARYRRTINGVISTMYHGQKGSSKLRGDNLPDYSKEDFRLWILSNDLFHDLYDRWIEAGCQRPLKPSCDRKDDYKPYTLGNLQLMTWKENNDKSHSDRVNGINTKQLKAVTGVHIETGESFSFYSIHEAARRTPAHVGSIMKVLKGQRVHSGGYKWTYSKNK